MKLIYILLIIATTISVKAQTISVARFGSCCGLLQNKIYCYGGAHGTPEDDIIDATMLVLDISQANATSMNDLQSKWQVETPHTAGVNTEDRKEGQCAVVGGTLLLLSAGYSGSNTLHSIVDQTIAFDVESKSWKKYPNYMEGYFGNRQIYRASTVEVPSKGLAFYGGYEDHINKNWTITTDQNITATELNDGTARAIGYTVITYLDITNNNNPWTVPYQSNAPSVFSSFQTSIFDPATKKIFYFGGLYHDTLLPDYHPTIVTRRTWHLLSYAPTFDTTSGVWGNESLKGDIIPTERRYHSTTLLPNGESTVLLYGGEKQAGVASKDLCFTLDLKTLTWSQQNINTAYVDLLRTRHSAVLANNDSLFIVHGIAGTSTVTSTPIALNISNPSSISYLEKYTDPNAPLIYDESRPVVSSSPETSSSKLGTGSIVGIAVGSAAVLAIMVVIFLLYKKKFDKRKRNQEIEAMEVNWDEIERHYEEVPRTYPLGPDVSLKDEHHPNTRFVPHSLVSYLPDTPSTPNSTVIGDGQHQNRSVPHSNTVEVFGRQKPDGGNFS